MAQKETAAPAGTGSGDGSQRFGTPIFDGLSGRFQYPPDATPCCRCLWLYGEKPREFGQKWPECYIAARRRPLKTCRWFLDFEDTDAIAKARAKPKARGCFAVVGVA